MGRGRYTTLSSLSQGMSSLIYGDTHRHQMAISVGLDGRTYHAINCGWLGDKNCEVFEYLDSHHQWVLGFGIIRVKDKKIYPQFVEIKEESGGGRSCLVDGKIVSL